MLLWSIYKSRDRRSRMVSQLPVDSREDEDYIGIYGTRWDYLVKMELDL